MKTKQTNNEFHENEKSSLIIKNINEIWNNKRVSLILRRLNLPFKSISKIKGEPFAIIYFDSNEECNLVKKALSNCKLGDKILSLENYRSYSWTYRMPYATLSEVKLMSKLKKPSFYEILYPLINLSNEDKIKTKKESVIRFINDIMQDDIEFVSSLETDLKHLCVSLNVGYTKNCDLTVGFHSGTKGRNELIEFDENALFPLEMVNIAKLFVSFLKESIFPPYDEITKTGKWWKIIIKLSSTNETMLSVITSGGLPLSEVHKLISTFSNKVNSLYWIKGNDKNYSVHSPNRNLTGSIYITERVRNLSYFLHVFTPFPPNISLYITLIENVINLAKIDKSSIIIDMSCGAGLIPLMLSPYCKRIIGIDENENFINCAIKNAEQNGIKNISFVTGSVDNILFDIINNINDGTLIAIYDSMNEGSQVTIMKKVHDCPKIKKFIYITESACDFSYDSQRILLNNSSPSSFPNFSLTDIKIFDFEPNNIHAKILGIFNR